MLHRIVTLLKVLNWLNWILAVLFVAFAAATFIPAFGDPLTALMQRKLSADQVVEILQIWRMLALLLIPTAYAVHRIFKAIIAIVQTAITGDPFITDNAHGLRIIGWALLAIQIIDLFSGLLMMRLSEVSGEYAGWSPAVTGWLAALLMFVLARIFEHGARMRDDLEGTI
ncbi:DUF2975 domain-containing protein [Sphingorhabdus arenilitoris]|uniref:DUF2975 domain-containing protein n=1 Tax=Sphingorhabdus arenilitoris TaxID=1490041 RepID=A0ABV8RC24_9SPHN